MKTFYFSVLIFFSFSSKLAGQTISSNGWYFPKTPMSNIFGYPFIDVESRNKEAVISNGNILTVDSVKDLTVNPGASYSRIFEVSWRQILLGNSYENNKNVEVKVESWRAKRWIFNRNRFNEFDLNTYYPIEGISADSIRITCKLTKKKVVGSKVIDDLLKDYLSGKTVAFNIIEGLNNNKTDTLKGIFSLLKEDTSEFIIEINKSNVIYALKFGKLKEKGKIFWQVQDGVFEDTVIPMGYNVRKTILNYPYIVGKNAGIVNVYVEVIKKRIDDINPKLVIHNQNAKDTIEFLPGNDIGNDLLHFEGNEIYKKGYSGNQLLQIHFYWNFDFDTKRNILILKGKNPDTHELENCIYRMDATFEVYP